MLNFAWLDHLGVWMILPYDESDLLGGYDLAENIYVRKRADHDEFVMLRDN